ncbi:MAG: hypothetical protein KIH08_01475 [Candidatus Freyarchaeota archaeon]|nr:hypothetical protein [Candidatus Jordarchaeia archaeon]MBS7269886.1 hypothetical protein [Candidatus Jordarchaeia archaeon]MBS7279186.1 hypothetical protein [Candidatus Jordarchaeia archaeon]
MNPKTRKVRLCEELGGTIIEIEVPLVSRVDPAEIRKELNLPDYINLDYLPMKRALVSIWAARNAGQLHLEFPNVIKGCIGKSKISNESLNILLFGGGAFKIHCPSTNAEGSAFNRVMKDVDLITSKKQGATVKNLLLCLGEMYGSMYTHFMLLSDKVFSAMRRGERWRVRAIDSINGEGLPVAGYMDILTEEINMRHKIDVRPELSQPPEKTLYTIGLENMLLTKCQFIEDHPRSVLEQLEQEGLKHRILSCNSHYDHNKIVIGMEDKDIKDVCAELLDHPIGEGGNEEINGKKIAKILEKDKKFRKTVRLNLEMILNNEGALKKFGAKNKEINTIFSRVEELLSIIPESPEKWNKPWWNTEVSNVEIAKFGD